MCYPALSSAATGCFLRPVQFATIAVSSGAHMGFRSAAPSYAAVPLGRVVLAAAAAAAAIAVSVSVAGSGKTVMVAVIVVIVTVR